MSSIIERVNDVSRSVQTCFSLNKFDEKKLSDGKKLSKSLSVNAPIVSSAVECLSLVSIGVPVDEAFASYMSYAKIAEDNGKPDAVAISSELLSNIKGLDDDSIVSACKLVSFGLWRNYKPGSYRSATAMTCSERTNPDADSIQDIRVLVERCTNFWNEYGPVVERDFDFKPMGYSKTVDSGKGEFLTDDTMWMLHFTEYNPVGKPVIELLTWYVMSKHSHNTRFGGVKNIGIFHPKRNIVYTLPIERIGEDTVKIIEKDVICYE